jgi:hypothetical protein
MKPDVWKHFALAAVFAIVLYAGSYSFIEHLRQRKGGWQVTFESDATGLPAVIVAQPRLSITNVQFRFLGEKITATNFRETIVFDRPITNAPFGQIIFIDTTFLPGTIAFEFFGHEVQLLPRVLVVNRREVAWRSGESTELAPAEKVPREAGKRLAK